MPAIMAPVGRALRYAFLPTISSPRTLGGGRTSGNLIIWGLVSAAIVVLSVFLSGSSVTLYLPHYYGWEWVEVTFVEFPAVMWALLWLITTGLCFYPRVTAVSLSVAFALYYFYAAGNGAATGLPGVRLPYLHIYAYHYYLPLFIAFTGVLTFVFYPARARSPQDRPSAVDIVLCLATLVATFDFVWNFAERGARAGLIHWNDVVFGTIMVIVSVEMCRRVLGLILPMLGVFFLAYCIWGQYLPGALAHGGFAFNEVIAYLYSESGIYGTIANVFATYVFLFIVFGAVLQMTKVGDLFVDVAFSLVGQFKGGAAKTAVISSGLIGAIIASGAANIVVTGTFTIPLMKRTGYAPHYAAGVEATSSIGGHLVPPVMGSTAFLMAAFTQVPYPTIALLSLVPALMYYYSVYMSVHYRACRERIEGLPREELPRFTDIMLKDGHRLLPVALLIVLLILQFSPFFAAFWSIAAALAVGCLREDTRLLQLPTPIARVLGWGGAPAPMEGEQIPTGPVATYGGLAAGIALLVGLPTLFAMPLPTTLFFAVGATVLFSSPRMIATLTQGSVNSLIIGATAGIMGIVLAGVTMPGLALRFPAIILEYAGGSLPIAIILCAIASYIMGMGMTITAAYVILAILAVPALVELGVPELNAHLIILWLSQDSSLTPPFALGAFIAAGIAGADPTRTGFSAVLLAKPLYVVPFLFAYTPILMDAGTPWWEILMVWSTGFVGFLCLAIAMEGFFRRRLAWWERIVFLAASALFFFHIWWMKLIAIAVMGLGIALQTMVKLPATEPAAKLEPGE